MTDNLALAYLVRAPNGGFIYFQNNHQLDVKPVKSLKQGDKMAKTITQIIIP